MNKLHLILCILAGLSVSNVVGMQSDPPSNQDLSATETGEGDNVPLANIALLVKEALAKITPDNAEIPLTDENRDLFPIKYHGTWKVTLNNNISQWIIEKNPTTIPLCHTDSKGKKSFYFCCENTGEWYYKDSQPCSIDGKPQDFWVRVINHRYKSGQLTQALMQHAVQRSHFILKDKNNIFKPEVVISNDIIKQILPTMGNGYWALVYNSLEIFGDLLEPAYHEIPLKHMSSNGEIIYYLFSLSYGSLYKIVNSDNGPKKEVTHFPCKTSHKSVIKALNNWFCSFEITHPYQKSVLFTQFQASQDPQNNHPLPTKAITETTFFSRHTLAISACAVFVTAAIGYMIKQWYTDNEDEENDDSTNSDKSNI